MAHSNDASKRIKTKPARSEAGGVKRVDPWIPVTDERFVWTRHADVQATWRKYGWTPPSENMEPVYVEPVYTPVWMNQVRRVK